ncbi:MAG: hypothetical protein HY868_11805 [Chloroflexi bacterium]|nr:hypothetical protein [Chloroflexota bacterium]
MCMFCAAVPAVAAMGVAAAGEHRKKIQAAETRGETRPRRAYHIGSLTVITMIGLFIVSAIYHSQRLA